MQKHKVHTKCVNFVESKRKLYSLEFYFTCYISNYHCYASKHSEASFI